MLEWTRLSDLTGNKTYARLAQKAQNYLVEPTGVPEAYPGLVGITVNIKDGQFTDNRGGWGGGVDSFYEYLIKMYLYDPKEFAHYKDRWVLAADSTMKHLASHPTSRKDLTFLAGHNGPRIIPASGHRKFMTSIAHIRGTPPPPPPRVSKKRKRKKTNPNTTVASFAGGNFILAGVLLNEPKYTEFGIALANSYYEAYAQTASKIGPEIFRWVPAESASAGAGNVTAPPAQDAGFYSKAGFWAVYKDYVLRPETIESLYYAYRVTGDRRYQDMAWEAFTAIRDRCRAGSGFSGLGDVTREDGGQKDDFQESFFLAETLKYSYLVFAEDSEVHFHGRGKNHFVYNTEAHPFRVRG